MFVYFVYCTVNSCDLQALSEQPARRRPSDRTQTANVIKYNYTEKGWMYLKRSLLLPHAKAGLGECEQQTMVGVALPSAAALA